MKIAYKVVKKINGRFMSAVKYNSVHRCVDYSQKGWIRPNKGENPFLFVFDTRNNAVKFLNDQSSSYGVTDLEILTVEIKKPMTKATGWWSGFVFSTESYPEGTIFCEALRVLDVRIAYKVVHAKNKNSKRFSSAVQCGDDEVYYQIGKITKPKKNANPFLFVFDNESNARHFFRQHGRNILKVEAFNTTTLVDNKIFHWDASAYPEGTLFAQAVRPLEVIATEF